MVRTWRWLVVSSLACGLVGCPGLKKGDDAGADGAVASAVPEAAPAPVAANDSEVTKYPDQTPDNMAPLTVRLSMNARTEASSTGGKVVGMLKVGEEADEIADHSGFDLVVFPDPSDATRKLEGWAPHTAFTAQPIHYTDASVPITDAAVVVADGGSDAGKVTKPLDEKRNANGTCNPGYGACGAMCRLTCKVDADCGLATAHCTSGFCLGPGASPCAH